MKVHVKPGVIIKEINERLIHVCITAFWLWQRYGLEPTITECYRGGSGLHPQHKAWDLRIWGLPDPGATAKEMDAMLNIRHHDYDVVFGDENHLDHIHVEYHPKKGAA